MSDRERERERGIEREKVRLNKRERVSEEIAIARALQRFGIR